VDRECIGSRREAPSSVQRRRDEPLGQRVGRRLRGRGAKIGAVVVRARAARIVARLLGHDRPAGQPLPLARVPVRRRAVGAREHGDDELRLLRGAREHARGVLLQQLVVRQLLRVGVRRDA